MRDANQPERSALSVGVGWAYRVMSVGLEFVVPALVGHWVDGRLRTGPWGVLIGATLGFIVGMTHLLQIAVRGAGNSK